MYSIKEPLESEQVLCWNCEEMVHESALQCPYCNIELRKHSLQKAPSESYKTQKITPISQYTVSHSVPQKQPLLEKKADSSFAFVCSLLLFLTGSSFLLLATFISFFSKEGFFTISWQEHSWSAFLGLGMAAIAFGTLFFQRISTTSE